MNYLFGDDTHHHHHHHHKSSTTSHSSSHSSPKPSQPSSAAASTSSAPSKHSSSRIRDLFKFLSSVQGDLSNVTAPPFFLSPSSVVEVGHCWAQYPSIFSAPALESDPARRALLVLKHILVSLRSQLYIGCVPEDSTEEITGSVKKPLNAFLGELFMAEWTDSEEKGGATVRLVSEQVSHHPPITAMCLVDEENGVRADGYARVEMSFNGNVDIRQVGHAVMHIDRYDEDYLIPLPHVRVKGYMSGKLYPEINGTYRIIGSNGYISEMRFSGAGLMSGTKNAVSARLYHKSDPSKTLCEASGCWSGTFALKDSVADATLETWTPTHPGNRPAPMRLTPLQDQDPWESRRAWAAVRTALMDNDFRAVIREKSKVEQAQRDMRANERQRGKKWKPLVFRSMKAQEYGVFRELTEGFDEWKLEGDRTLGVWRADLEKLKVMERPFRRELTPDGS